MIPSRLSRGRVPFGRAWSPLVSLLVLALVSLAGSGASAQGSQAPGGDGALAGPAARPGERYSLVISGGVSLGAYEAGLLWALTQLVERSDGRIVGVAGASAGAINGMLTALAVCADPRPLAHGLVNPFRTSGLEGNPFYDSWTSVGVGDLLPSEARDEPRDGSGRPPGGGEGVLKRDLVDDLFARLRALVDTAGIWKADCALPYAVTVTCAVPTVRTEAGIPAPVQRFAIPLKLVSTSVGKVTRVTFDNQIEVLTRAREAGDVLFLAERVAYTNGLHPQDVLDAVRASSSFPLAFGPTELTYCVPASECPADLPSPAEMERLERRNAAYTCANVYDRLAASGLSPWRLPGQNNDPFLEPCTSRFVDGGVFDNTPLGLAIAQSESATGAAGLSEPGREPAVAPVAPITYLYIDPDLRRHGPEATLEPNVGRRGVRRVGAVLAEVIATARRQALHDALRYVRFNVSLSPQLAAAGRSLAAATELLASPDSLTLKRLEAKGVSARERRKVTQELRDARARVDGFERTIAASWDAGTWEQELRAFVDWASPLLARTHARLGLDAPFGLLREPVELAGAVLRDPREARRLVALRRFPPLAASQLANFGAFLDAPFREHDFAAGVYDAAEGLAVDQLRSVPRLDDSQKTAQLIRELPLGAGAASPASAVASTLVNDFAKLEWEPDPAAPHARGGCADDAAERVRAACAVARALQSRRAECEMAADTSACFDDPPFEHFLAELRERDYQPVSEEMRSMLHNRQWWALLTARALLRLSEIEQDELDAIRQDVATTKDQPAAVRRANRSAAEAQEALVRVVRQGAYWLRAVANARSVFEADPSSVPDDGAGLWGWHLLPYWMEVDALRGGAGVGYEPGFSWGWGELRIRLAAARYWADDHVTPFVVRSTLARRTTPTPCGTSFVCDREHHASSAAGLTLAFPDLGTRMLSLGVGAEADLGWFTRLVQFGGSVYVGTLLDRLRLKLGARVIEWDLSRGGGPYLRGGAWLWDLRVELADVNGMLWEAAR